MKTRHRLILGACMLVVSGLVTAQDATVQIRANPARYTLPQGQFSDYDSSYELSNDRSIRFIQRGQRYYVELDSGPRAEMYPIKPAVFATGEGARIEFHDRGNEVTIYHYETLPTAGIVAGNVTVLARR